MLGNWKSCTLLVIMKNGAATIENKMALYRFKYTDNVYHGIWTFQDLLQTTQQATFQFSLLSFFLQ